MTVKLPFSFKEYIKSPFAAISLLCILGMGYLYIDARSAQNTMVEACRQSEKNKIERITKLEKDVADLQTKIIEILSASRDDD